jgi:hypothetical protein
MRSDESRCFVQFRSEMWQVQCQQWRGQAYQQTSTLPKQLYSLRPNGSNYYCQHTSAHCCRHITAAKRLYSLLPSYVYALLSNTSVHCYQNTSVLLLCSFGPPPLLPGTPHGSNIAALSVKKECRHISDNLALLTTAVCVGHYCYRCLCGFQCQAVLTTAVCVLSQCTVISESSVR